MGCACQSKWLVVDKDDKIVHRAKTQEAAQAVADRNAGDLRVMHDNEHRKLQLTKRTNRKGRGGGMLEVVTRDGKVLTTTTHKATADRVAARYAKIGATVRPATTTSTAR